MVLGTISPSSTLDSACYKMVLKLPLDLFKLKMTFPHESDSACYASIIRFYCLMKCTKYYITQGSYRSPEKKFHSFSIVFP